MQLPPDDEIVMVAGTRPIRAKKARYYQDQNLMARIFAPVDPAKRPFGERAEDAWLKRRAEPPSLAKILEPTNDEKQPKSDDGGHDRQQEFDEGRQIIEERANKEPQNEFEALTSDQATSDRKTRDINNQLISVARQTDLDQDNPSNM